MPQISDWRASDSGGGVDAKYEAGSKLRVYHLGSALTRSIYVRRLDHLNELRELGSVRATSQKAKRLTEALLLTGEPDFERERALGLDGDEVGVPPSRPPPPSMPSSSW